MNWIDIAVTILLSALKDTIKNPAKKAGIRGAMLKLAATINVVFSDDLTFQKDLKKKTDNTSL